MKGERISVYSEARRRSKQWIVLDDWVSQDEKLLSLVGQRRGKSKREGEGIGGRNGGLRRDIYQRGEAWAWVSDEEEGSGGGARRLLPSDVAIALDSATAHHIQPTQLLIIPATAPHLATSTLFG